MTFRSAYVTSITRWNIYYGVGSASSASILPSDKKRIESEWGALIEQLWDAAIASSDGDSSNQVRFKAYTDNIATLMLHPEVANLTGLESQPPPFTISNNNTPISSGLGLGLGPTPNKIIRNISSSSIVSSLTGNTETLTAAKVQKLPLVYKPYMLTLHSTSHTFINGILTLSLF